jgi:hypothetical protein
MRPEPLGYVVSRLAVAAGATLRLPPGAVMPGTLHDFTRCLTDRPCTSGGAGVVVRGALAADGALLTAATDPSASVPLCPSRLAGPCGRVGPGGWAGVVVEGGSVSLVRSTLRHAAGAAVRGDGRVTLDRTTVEHSTAAVDLYDQSSEPVAISSSCSRPGAVSTCEASARSGSRTRRSGAVACG